MYKLLSVRPVPNAGGWYGASLECGVFNVYAK